MINAMKAVHPTEYSLSKEKQLYDYDNIIKTKV